MNLAPAHMPRPPSRRVRASQPDDGLTRFLELWDDSKRPSRRNVPAFAASVAVFVGLLGLFVALVRYLINT